MATPKKTKKPAKRFYRKRVELFRLIDKIKLWPSRKGILHGIKTIEKMGDQAQITTHCNKTFTINDSRNRPAGSETNGSKACAGFAEFLNGSWKSIHPPSLNATLDPC
jgi:pyrrolysyl-tRNA synthetase-like protein